jgi:MFS superfamily sulfate permease-like transporter
MAITVRKSRFYLLSFLKHDFKASISVFFVALPLCLGISLASGAPVHAGLIAGILGGLVVSLVSGSELSVSGPAAGLTAICAAAILELGSFPAFTMAVAMAGILQVAAGMLKLGGFTSFIPSSVIKGMLAAIGILLVAKQVPMLLGYGEPDFWTHQLMNLLTFRHGFSRVRNFVDQLSPGVMVLSALSFFVLLAWDRFFSRKLHFVPSSFVLVISGMLLAWVFSLAGGALALKTSQYVQLPPDLFGQLSMPRFDLLLSQPDIWKNALLICFVASLETLLSVEAIDKLDPYNRITPQNRELVAQGTGNFLSGALGGIPITAVIVRSSANAEAGARTWLSAFAHGLWLLLVVLLGVRFVNAIPYCVLAVILVRTGYNLAKPAMLVHVYRQGREQFVPFLVTILAILLTDLLIGVLIGLVYSVYFLVKHTYRAGFVLKASHSGHISHFQVDLALNVSFLNKKKIQLMLDGIPPYSEVVINGENSVYIDHDILEIIQDYKSKAHLRHIQLELINIPEVKTIELH